MKTCKDLMTRNPISALPEDTAARVAWIMKNEDIGSVPICENQQSKRLVGIITDRDLALQVVAEGRDPNSMRARDVMSRQIVACRADDDFQKALEAMEDHQIRRIPVVDDSGRLLGIIAQADVATRSGLKDETAEMLEEVSRPSTMRAG